MILEIFWTVSLIKSPRGLMVFDETKQLVIDETKRNETKQSLTLEKSGNCSSAAPNTLDTIAVLFR